MSAPAFPYVIVSGYKTPRQQFFVSAGFSRAGYWSANPHSALPFRYLGWARVMANDCGARRKRLAIVKNYGTRYERVVWERNK